MGQTNIAELMGGSRVLGKAVHSPLDLADIIEAGLPREAAEQVRAYLHLTEQEMADCLGVSTKTLQRLAKQPKGLLSRVQGDRLYRLARIVALAEQVFEDTGRAHSWLREPQRGLGYRIPLELMRTEVGAREVENLLGRIEYGVLS
jgi:putative toxin-antitoxin system antitoxin component (TIGR02293 family)